MGFRLRKSIRLGGGARLNISTRGIGASWGFKGFRVGVSPSRRSIFSLPKTTTTRRRTSTTGATTSTATASGSGSGTSFGYGCFVVLAALFVIWLISVIVAAVIAAFSTPYPWIVIGLAGAGYALYAAFRAFRRQRDQKLFFDTVAALHAAALEAPQLMAVLLDEGADDADSLLLGAADASSRGRHEDALSYFKRALGKFATLGRLSEGIELQFLGLPAPIWFGAQPSVQSSLSLAHGHLSVLAGRPGDAVAMLRHSPSDPYYPLAASVLADAHCALGDPAKAAGLLEHALENRRLEPEIGAFLRAKLGRVFTSVGMLAKAAAEYEAAIAQGGQGDLNEQLSAIRQELAAQEHKAREQAQRDAEEKLAQKQRAREQARRDAEETLTREDEQTFARTVTKLEAAKGPAGRRAALQAGLTTVHRPAMRDRLLLEASRVEVQAVLDKVDGLKTPAAKRRHLLAALEALRADEIPDELQAQQIGWLEQALKELEAGPS